MPERIKVNKYPFEKHFFFLNVYNINNFKHFCLFQNEADEMMVLGSPMTETLNTESAGLNDSFMDPLLDSLPNAHFDNEFNFDFNDHNYRYHEVSTPCSSLSPASSGPLQSPASYSILGHDPSVSSPSPPPSTKQLTEFLHASSNSQYPFEADFSKLTLTG